MIIVNIRLICGINGSEGRVDGFRKLPMARATSTEATLYGCDQHDFATDLLTAIKEFTLQTRTSGGSTSREGTGGVDNLTSGFGLSREIPTFKRATQLEKLTLSMNSFRTYLDSPQYPRGHDLGLPVRDHTNPVSGETEYSSGYYSIGYQHSTLTEAKYQQNYGLRGDVSFHKLANENINTSKGMQKLTYLMLNYNNIRRIVDFGYETDDPWPQLYFIDGWDAHDCPGYSKASRQAILEPTSTTGVTAKRWLLDRRKDGTSHKYEFLIPPLKNRFPRLRRLRLVNWDQQSERGPYKGFTPDGDDNIFEGCRFGHGSTWLDVRGNGFNKQAIVQTMKAMDKLYTEKPDGLNRGGGQFRFDYQRGYSSPSGSDPLARTGTPGLSGNTDFRIFPYGRTGRISITDLHPDNVYRNPHPDTSLHQLNSVADNDLFVRCKEVHNMNLQGIEYSKIPDDLDAPGEVILSLTGTGANQLHATRQSGNQFNLYNWAPSQLVGTLIIGTPSGPIDSDSTISMRVYRLNWQGVETEIGSMYYDASLNPIPTSLSYPIVLDINGLNDDINKGYNIAPFDLANPVAQTSPGVDGTDFSNGTQTFSIKVVVESLRGNVEQKTINYTFVNFVQTRTGSTDDANHALGEWKTEIAT